MSAVNISIRRFKAIYFIDSSIRNITFEALNLDEAKKLATAWGFGLQGEVETAAGSQPEAVARQEAYDVQTACRIMGDISRTTLYRLLVRGKLERLPHTRKVLVTRRSIERYCALAV